MKQEITIKTALVALLSAGSLEAFARQEANGGGGVQPIITEVCVANIDQTLDYSNNYGSWIELYNPSAAAISLDGWYISDDAQMLQKHKLSGLGILRPKCYQCIFFDHNAADGEYGPDASRQVRFKQIPRWRKQFPGILSPHHRHSEHADLLRQFCRHKAKSDELPCPAR